MKVRELFPGSDGVFEVIGSEWFHQGHGFVERQVFPKWDAVHFVISAAGQPLNTTGSLPSQNQHGGIVAPFLLIRFLDVSFHANEEIRPPQVGSPISKMQAPGDRMAGRILRPISGAAVLRPDTQLGRRILQSAPTPAPAEMLARRLTHT